MFNDSENSDNVEVIVNGQNAVFRDNDNKKELYWEYDNFQVQLFTFDNSIDVTYLTTIADGIKKFYKIL